MDPHYAPRGPNYPPGHQYLRNKPALGPEDGEIVEEHSFRINDRVMVIQEGNFYHKVGTVIGWFGDFISVQLTGESSAEDFKGNELLVIGHESVDSLSCSNPYLISMAFSRPSKPKKSGVWPRGLNTKRVDV